MNEKELYSQKMQAQLDEWKADLDKMKAKAKKADADVKIKSQKQLKELESKIEAGQVKLKEFKESSGDAWLSLKGGLESAWSSLKSGFEEAASKYR